MITLEPLDEEDLFSLLNAALKDEARGLGTHHLTLTDDAAAHLIRMSDGDGRNALNNLEMAAFLAMARQAPQKGEVSRSIDIGDIEQAVQQRALQYDKSGEEHYNLISAQQKKHARQ